MKTAPIVAARIDAGPDGLPWSPDYADVYHPRSGALAQARHVFLGGNGLPARWAGRRDFVVLETGFGLGNNFLATWAAWRADAQRCERLHYLSIEAHPPACEALAALAREADVVDLAAQLAAGVHALSIQAFTPQQWVERGGVVPPSPPCLGGSKAEALS